MLHAESEVDSSERTTTDVEKAASRNGVDKMESTTTSRKQKAAVAFAVGDKVEISQTFADKDSFAEYFNGKSGRVTGIRHDDKLGILYEVGVNFRHGHDSFGSRSGAGEHTTLCLATDLTLK